MKVALLLLLGALCSCGESGPSAPDWGVEFVYRARADERQSIQAGARVIEKRLALLDFPHAAVRDLDGERIRVRVPGVDRSNIRRAGLAIAGGWLVEVFETAGAAAQDAYASNRIVPPDSAVAENVESSKRPTGPDHRAWQGDRILIKRSRLIDGDMINDAWAEPHSDGTWRTLFLLSKEGGVRARSRGSSADPLAFMETGKLVAIARVTFSRSGDEGRIEGLSGEREATDLAFELMGGSLLVRVGGGPYKGPAEYEFYGSNGPESFEFYGTPPAKAP